MDFRICSQFDFLVIYDRFKVTFHLYGCSSGKKLYAHKASINKNVHAFLIGSLDIRILS